MSSVTTTRPINREQLMGELAVETLRLDGGPDDPERTVTVYDDTITQAQLEAVVGAHVAIDTEGNARTVEKALTLDQDKLAATRTALDAIIAKTNAQITAADTKDIARELRTIANVLRRVLRRSLGDYTGTD